MLGEPKVEGLPRGFAVREEYDNAEAVPLESVGGGDRRLYGVEWILRPAEASIARRVSPGWKACFQEGASEQRSIGGDAIIAATVRPMILIAYRKKAEKRTR